MTLNKGCCILFLRSLVWVVLIPGTVTVYFPCLIVARWNSVAPNDWILLQFLGLVLMVTGAAVLIHCVFFFAVVGQGTLSPLDSPKHLVVHGIYRHVRNPMYLAVLMILFGEALWFGSTALVVYALGWFGLINLGVIFYEEPKLRERFGESYVRYCRAVGRWLPGKAYNDA